ncbi:MAG: ribulose-phosphate 3-epimerase [Ginsengibacter sp.]
MAIIAPSILSADFLHLERDCNMLDSSEADWFHLDVMDGRFVPNISFGMSVISQIRKTTKKFFDVHLMILEPEKYLVEFKKAGADGITVHFEVCNHLNSVVRNIKDLGLKAGVAINPHTPVDFLKNIIRDVDLVLLMSVNPGFGGQSFIEGSLEKIATLKKMIIEDGSKAKVEVDGGINLKNAKQIIEARADILVAGNAVFGSENPTAVIGELKRL